MVDRAKLAVEAEARAVDRTTHRGPRVVVLGGPLQNLWTTVSERYEIILVLRCITNYKVAFPVTLTGLDTIQLRLLRILLKQLGEQRFEMRGTFEFYDKKEGTERQSSRIWRVRIIAAVEFTVSENICTNRGRPLYGQVGEVNSDAYGRVVNGRSSKTTEQLCRRYRMRDRRSWTMRPQPVRMPVP
jgi:hypothetical protein